MKNGFLYQIRSFRISGHAFGLSNALINFHGYINKIFAKKLDIFLVVLLDNILIYTEDLGQPNVNVVR